MAEPAQKKPRTKRTMLFNPESTDLCDESQYAELDTCLHQDPESHVACETANDVKDKDKDKDKDNKKYAPYEKEREEKAKGKEKARGKEQTQWDEHGAHIAAYSAADDPWMMLLLM